MTDYEWEKIKRRMILAAFQTGRPISSTGDGGLRYADGDHEPVADQIGTLTPIEEPSIPTRSWWARMKYWIGTTFGS